MNAEWQAIMIPTNCRSVRSRRLVLSEKRRSMYDRHTGRRVSLPRCLRARPETAR